jgi:hypothetical protein
VAAALGAAGPAGAPVTAAAAPPRVDALVVTRDGGIAAAGRVRVAAATVRAGGRPCRVGEGTPLAALAALRRVGGPVFRATGDCGALYVDRIGRQGETRLGGWVYKVGRRLPSVGSADPSARLRPGQRVTWFFCERAGACQRTLEVRPARRRVAPGGTLGVSVRAYDDRGRGRAATGVEVAFGDATATTGTDGRATLRAPRRRGRQAVTARSRGLVTALPVEVVVGS